LNENLKQPHELVQKAASSALRQFLFTYFSSSATDPSENLQTVTVLKYLEGLKKGDNVAVTRGSALALGVLPYRLAIQPEGRLADILSVLLEASNPNKLIAGEPDVETRRAAVQAVVEIAERLPLKGNEMKLCFEILLRSCDDYKTDKRGDTGSWCRIAAVQGMEKMLYTCFRKIDSTGATRMTSFGPGTVAVTSSNSSADPSTGE
jgi:hypothetical protein